MTGRHTGVSIALIHGLFIFFVGAGAESGPSDVISSGGFLKGVRDLVYDESRSLIFTAAIHGTVSIINVKNSSNPFLVSSVAPSTVLDAHGLAMDHKNQRLFVASVSQASVTCIDVTRPETPRIVSTVRNTTWLYYSTHLSFDPHRSALFVASAGNGNESMCPSCGHSISSITVNDFGLMTLRHRMTSWYPDTSPGVNKTLAYPVYTLLDPERPLLYVSNDARCTVEASPKILRNLKP